MQSKSPVVLSFSHFVTRCCANGFYESGPFSLSLLPCSLVAVPSASFSALLLGGKLSVFVFFYYWFPSLGKQLSWIEFGLVLQDTVTWFISQGRSDGGEWMCCLWENCRSCWSGMCGSCNGAWPRVQPKDALLHVSTRDGSHGLHPGPAKPSCLDFLYYLRYKTWYIFKLLLLIHY